MGFRGSDYNILSVSYPQSIEEVGGYVLIGINYVEVIPLENLRLIRGHSLFDGKYALAVVANFHRNESLENSSINGLIELRMRSLTGRSTFYSLF